METIQAWKAADGHLFETEEECKEHEFSIRWRPRIQAFQASPFYPYRQGSPAQTTMLEKMLVGWIRFEIASRPPHVLGQVEMDEADFQRFRDAFVDAHAPEAPPSIRASEICEGIMGPDADISKFMCAFERLLPPSNPPAPQPEVPPLKGFAAAFEMVTKPLPPPPPDEDGF
jgi:hypothetical protein